MMRSDNIVLCTLSHFARKRNMAIGFAYNVNVLLMPDDGVKNTIRTSFASFVYIEMKMIMIVTVSIIFFLLHFVFF